MLNLLYVNNGKMYQKYILESFKQVCYLLFIADLLLAYSLHLEVTTFLLVLFFTLKFIGLSKLVFVKKWDPILISLSYHLLGSIIMVLLTSWQLTIIFNIAFGVLHTAFLRFFPYTRSSRFLMFSVKRTSFNENARVMAPLLSGKLIFLVKSCIIFCFYLVLSGSLGDYTYVIEFLALGLCFIFFMDIIVELINIYFRPSMPAELLVNHPLAMAFPFFVQKRNLPYFDFIINKALPAGSKFVSGLLTVYGGTALGCKLTHGATTIDPIRNYYLNTIHDFPKTYNWSEVSLEAWKKVKTSSLYEEKSHLQFVNEFVEANKKATDDAAKAILGYGKKKP